MHYNVDALAAIDVFWDEYGFEPWSSKGLAGVYRRVTFSKSSLMGEVGRYYSDDYILWDHGGQPVVPQILEMWKPQPDVMSHRVILLSDDTAAKPAHRGFLWGFRGWVDVLMYRAGDPPGCLKFRDLQILASNACNFARMYMEEECRVHKGSNSPSKFAAKGV